MKAIELKLPDDVYQKLEELVGAVENFAELERRATRGSMDKFRAAMCRVPDVTPTPGDELPR